jgi:hypothetical protein
MLTCEISEDDMQLTIVSYVIMNLLLEDMSSFDVIEQICKKMNT